MIWVTFYLALRPDCQDSIREEITSMIGDSGKAGAALNYWDLKNAAVVDSFIREVLRMKNDSVNLVRSTIRDVEMGGYIVPKGSSLSLIKRQQTIFADMLRSFRLHGIPDDLPILSIDRVPLRPR